MYYFFMLSQTLKIHINNDCEYRLLAIPLQSLIPDRDIWAL